MILLLVICGAAAIYQLMALAACVLHLRKRDPQPVDLPGVSILKPLYGADAHLLEALASHARVEYPKFEILLGVQRDDDPAIPVVEQLQREYPNVDIRLFRCMSDAPNAKVGSLEVLSRGARYPVRVINDSDIIAPPNYLHTLLGPLENRAVGLVTCIYRASGDTMAARFEALGIATDFVPSTLVAPLVGVNEFGLGSTLCYRAADLERAGGFARIRDYIADDYQLGKNITSLGLRAYISTMPVETHLGASSWSGIWRHQLRWARTIRLSRGAYFGLPVTFATVWALCAAAAGWWSGAVALIILRLTVAATAGAILKDPLLPRWLFAVPFRDLWGAAVWVAGTVGSTVEWRGKRITLDANGRITE